MQEKSLIAKEIEFIVVSRRIKLLGTAIGVGIIIVYILGLYVSGNNINEKLEILNPISLIIALFICSIGLVIKNLILKKVNTQNFADTYFNAHIIPFALYDFGGLFCVTTNLFVNENLIYATIGVILSSSFIFLSFPKKDHFQKLFHISV